MRSDDFTLKTKRLLAHRVAYTCSNPECLAPTAGPGLDTSKAVSVGDAAHITAASPAGPRHKPSLTPQERRSYDNGIWLCVNDARIVDQDESRHTVELLKDWKLQAERRAYELLGKPRAVGTISDDADLFEKLAKSVIAGLRIYDEESATLGIEGPLAQLSKVATKLGSVGKA